jgi:putative restriction endonuclease
MKKGQNLWTEEELILAVNLYAKLPFGKMHSRNPKVIELANLMGRTPSAIALKLGNFASFDPNLQKRGIKGASNTGKLDRKIWDKFYEDWDRAFEDSDTLLAERKKVTVEMLYDNIQDKKGLEKERFVHTRINQYRFRELVLANYDSTCCITGIKNSELLIASHITSWSKFENNRLDPRNGLCLNALHDRAFDAGLLTVCADDYTIKVSSLVLKNSPEEYVNKYFECYEGKQITIPKKFPPSKEFLLNHNKHFKNSAL